MKRHSQERRKDWHSSSNWTIWTFCQVAACRSGQRSEAPPSPAKSEKQGRHQIWSDIGVLMYSVLPPMYKPLLQRLIATCPQTCQPAAHERLALDLAAHHWAQKHERISSIQLKDMQIQGETAKREILAEPKGRNDSICQSLLRGSFNVRWCLHRT